MISEYIEKMFKRSFEKQYYETYWVFDLHGTIIVPTYKGTQMQFYPYAIETLRYLSTYRSDIKKILWTSSFPDEIKEYVAAMQSHGVFFESINENPGISSNSGNFGYYEKKFYFNVLIDDKAGFDPEKEWENLWYLFIDYEGRNYKPSPYWTTKY